MLTGHRSFGTRFCEGMNWTRHPIYGAIFVCLQTRGKKSLLRHISEIRGQIKVGFPRERKVRKASDS